MRIFGAAPSTRGCAFLGPAKSFSKKYFLLLRFGKKIKMQPSITTAKILRQIIFLFVAVIFLIQFSFNKAKAQTCCDVPGLLWVVEITIDNTFAGNTAQTNYPV